MIYWYYDNLESNLYSMFKRYWNVLEINSEKVFIIDWLLMPWYVSRTNCIILYGDRTAGFTNVYLKGFIILLVVILTQLFMGWIWQLYMNRRNGITISVITWNWEEGRPSRSGIWIWPHTDVRDDIPKGHNKHTGSVRGNMILSRDCKKG